MTFLRSLFIILFLLLGAREAFSQESFNIGKAKNLFTVDEIQVEGVKKVEPEAILEKVAVRVGMQLDNHLVRKDIQSIYGMKHFDSVEVHHRVRKGKNVLIFRVQEKPIVNKITIRGNREVDTSEIMDQIKVKEFGILDTNTIKNDVVKLQKFYEGKGFFLANINFEIKKGPRQTAEVIFKIQEFEKVAVKDITFLGNKRFSDRELMARMEIREESLFSALSGAGSFKEFNFKTTWKELSTFTKTTVTFKSI